MVEHDLRTLADHVFRQKAKHARFRAIDGFFAVLAQNVLL
jgi:hypothetical protein